MISYLESSCRVWCQRQARAMKAGNSRLSPHYCQRNSSTAYQSYEDTILNFIQYLLCRITTSTNHTGGVVAWIEEVHSPCCPCRNCWPRVAVISTSKPKLSQLTVDVVIALCKGTLGRNMIPSWLWRESINRAIGAHDLLCLASLM